jgi:hypothetical protein
MSLPKILLIILIILAVIIGIKATINSNKALTLTSCTEGQTLQCLDLSQYYQLGYTNSIIDENQCQIVSKQQITSQLNMGQDSNRGCWGNVPNQVHGGTTNRDYCHENVGSSYVMSCEDVASSTAGNIICTAYTIVIAGGGQCITPSNSGGSSSSSINNNAVINNNNNNNVPNNEISTYVTTSWGPKINTFFITIGHKIKLFFDKIFVRTTP